MAELPSLGRRRRYPDGLTGLRVDREQNLAALLVEHDQVVGAAVDHLDLVVALGNEARARGFEGRIDLRARKQEGADRQLTAMVARLTEGKSLPPKVLDQLLAKADGIILACSPMRSAKRDSLRKPWPWSTKRWRP